jgi:hypothetical protein
VALQDKNSFADVWEQLDAKYAERVRVTDAAALGDEEIVRRWPQIGEGYLSKCLTALSLFTDSKNSKPQLWVKDPVVGRETFPGTYRVVTVDVDVQKPGLKGIIQTLRKGFAESPQWTEARIERKIAALSNTVGVAGISGTTSDPVDQVFDVLFPNCSPLAIESIAAALRAGNYSGGITVRGETHSGAWHVLSVSTKIEEDGSATATLRVATPQYTITAYDDYGLDRAMDVHYVMDVPKDQAQGIVNAWKAAHEVGASATVSYSRDQKLVDIVLRETAAEEHEFDAGLSAADCRYTESETIYLNVADADSYPISAPTSGDGVSYTRNVTRNINGTWDITIKTRTARYRDAGNAVVEVSAAQATQQRQQLGVTIEPIESIMETLGAVKSQRVEIRDDCSKDVTTTTETGKPLVTTEKTVARSYEETINSTQTASAVVADPVQAAGYVKTVRNEQSKYPGRWNVLERIRRILHIPSAVKYDSRDDAAAHGRTEESTGVPNTSGVAVVLSADAGTAVRAQVRYDKESDTLDVSKDVTTAKEQITTEKTEARSYRETVTQKTAQSSPLVDPTVETGKIKTVRNEASDYAGRYNTTERVREIKLIDKAVEYDSADDAEVHGRTVERLGQPNEGVAVVLSAENGEAVSATVQYDKESDTLDTKVVVLEGKETTSVSEEESGLSRTVTEDKTCQGVEATALPGGGQIVRAENRKSRYEGKYDTRTSVETGKPQTSTAKIEAAGFSETTTEKTVQAAPAPAPAAVPGHIKTARTSASKYTNRYDTTETDREVKPLDATASGGSPLWDDVSVVNDNATNDLSGQAAGGPGVIIDASSKKNDAGRFDNRKTTRTAKPYGPVTSIHGSPLVEETVERSRNQDSMPSPGTPADGTMVDVSGSINDAAKIDVTTTTRRAIAKEKTGIRTGETAFENETTDLHVNKESVAIVRASGEAVDANLSINEFGRLSGSVRKREAKEVQTGPYTADSDGYKQTQVTKYQNAGTIPIASGKGQRVDAQKTEFGLFNATKTVVTATEFYIDYSVPAATGRSPSFSRMYFGIENPTNIQLRIQDFFATVNAITTDQYVFGCGVSRDGDGFYELRLSANPKQAGGGSSEWDDGFDFDMPDMTPASEWNTTSAKVTFTTNKNKVQNLLTAASNACYSGAGGGTQVQFLGRGRYKVTITTGA